MVLLYIWTVTNASTMYNAFTFISSLRILINQKIVFFTQPHYLVFEDNKTLCRDTIALLSDSPHALHSNGPNALNGVWLDLCILYSVLGRLSLSGSVNFSFSQFQFLLYRIIGTWY